MQDDLSLFGDDRLEPPATTTPGPARITDWQIDLLRKALDARGLASMTDRQRAIEDAAGRAVPTLRDLSHDEALSVLSRLGPAPTKPTTGSAWDQRDEDTWIDRL